MKTREGQSGEGDGEPPPQKKPLKYCRKMRKKVKYFGEFLPARVAAKELKELDEN